MHVQYTLSEAINKAIYNSSAIKLVPMGGGLLLTRGVTKLLFKDELR